MLRPLCIDDGLPDPATLEWWESEEFPRRALRAEASRKASECPALGDLPSPATADWLSSQQWPTYPLLCSEQHTAPLSTTGRCMAQPLPAARSACPYRGPDGHTQGRRAANRSPYRLSDYLPSFTQTGSGGDSLEQSPLSKRL
jgi:hypothetical protein